MVRIPKQKRSINTVNSIIEAAFICVGTHGIHDTTIQKISEISGVSMGSIYEYFENKHDIFAMMRTHFMRDVMQIMQPALHGMEDKSIRELVSHIVYSVKDFLELRNGVYMRWFKETVDVDGSLQSQQELDKVRVFLTQIILNYAVSRPEIISALGKNLNVMIYIFINSGIFTIGRYLTEQNSQSFVFDELVDGLCDLIEGYLQFQILQQKE